MKPCLSPPTLFSQLPSSFRHPRTGHVSSYGRGGSFPPAPGSPGILWAICQPPFGIWSLLLQVPALLWANENRALAVLLTSVSSLTHVCAGHVSTCQCHLLVTAWCWGRVGALGPVAPLARVPSSSSASLQVISHDTRRFRFALPSPEHILGLPVGECSPDPAHMEPASAGKGRQGGPLRFSESREGFKEDVSAIRAFKGECQKERAKYPSVPGSGPSRSKGRELGCDGSPWSGRR